MDTFTIETNQETELVNITERVEGIVSKSKVKNGICLIFVKHATAGIIVNEDESNLREDLVSFFSKIAPKSDWKHNKIDDNAEAHLKSAMIGQGRVLPIQDGKLVRGTWQDILLCEFDGPRTRNVVVVCK